MGALHTSPVESTREIWNIPSYTFPELPSQENFWLSFPLIHASCGDREGGLEEVQGKLCLLRPCNVNYYSNCCCMRRAGNVNGKEERKERKVKAEQAERAGQVYATARESHRIFLHTTISSVPG